MNYERGLKRVWYLILGIICIFVEWLAFVDGGAFKMGETLVYLLVFALVWQLIGAVLLWVVRGFRKDAPQQVAPK